MRYYAIGDSMSIDKYTGVVGGGAASRFARMIGATEYQNLAADGATTAAILAQAKSLPQGLDVVTVTAGGNDFLEAIYWRGLGTEAYGVHDAVRVILERLETTFACLKRTGAACIANTVYDPTDSSDAELGAFGGGGGDREAFHRLNEGVRNLAKDHGFLLADLEAIFRGHSEQSSEPWLTQQIEPNLAGAGAIAEEWRRLYEAV